MAVPIQNLDEEQKFWYANLVVAAVLADDKIFLSEIEFLKQVIAIITSQEKRSELMEIIDKKKPPQLTAPPPGIPPKILVAIYIELILIIISDYDFADDERKYLKEVADLFNFDEGFYRELMNWCEDGLRWKTDQRELVSSDLQIEGMQIPLKRLNDKQKRWYSQTLVATVMLDGLVDQIEKSFLKMAISFLEDPQDKKQMLAYIGNKISPPMVRPPPMPKQYLMIVLIEVILIISADESLSYREIEYLQKISDNCGFSKEEFNRLMDWCNHGINWKQNKNSLFVKCRFKEKTRIRDVEGGLEDHPENNSVQTRFFECYLCGPEVKVQAFHLKPKSQKLRQNIFGITIYDESMPKFDYINFSLIKVIVCPTCFFASPHKEYFKKSKDDKAPHEMNLTALKQNWMESLKAREELIGDNPDELLEIKRSISTVIKTYQLAILTAEALVKNDHSDNLKWQLILLKLTLAEITMSAQQENKAEELLKQVNELAETLFNQSSNNIVSFKAAKILLIIAVYEKDDRKANQFYEFFTKMLKEKVRLLKKTELSVLQKVYGEVKEVYLNRNNYAKKKLDGFLPP
ncbi:MAG: DUF2225 domain-containing protein [Deltaproteobacteria bacterium]|nr:DUF2225 domain-containing protein [Deltaproteobacteria bacterium]